MNTYSKGFVNLWVKSPHGESPPPPMFGGHWPNASGDIEYFILFEWVLFMMRHHLAKFGSHRYCGSRDMFLVCHRI